MPDRKQMSTAFWRPDEDIMTRQRYPDFVINGLEEYEKSFHQKVLNGVVEALFGDGVYPALKSDIITIDRRQNATTPLYVAGTSQELIIVNSKENYPWQFAYQAAHELGHLAARADLRFPRQDGHMWIEEALCECHSLIGIGHLASSQGSMFEGARRYLGGLMRQWRDEDITAEWYAVNRQLLTEAAYLTPEAKRISRFIYDLVDAERIIRDNRLLQTLPIGTPQQDLIAAWRAASGPGRSVPEVLETLFS